MIRSTTCLKRPLLTCLAVVFWLAVWQAAAMWIGKELILPSPLTVLRRLGSLVEMGTFWLTAAASLGRILLGLVWGTTVGCVLAWLTCRFRWADLLLSPAVRVIRATPVASFILLVLLWTRRETVPVVISGLMVLPVIWENVSLGMRRYDPKLLELARMYRFTPLRTARYICLPAVYPYFLSGLTNAVGLAWKSGVAAEVLCLPRPAVGTQIYHTKLYLETPDLFAWTLTVILLSLVLERLVRLLLRSGGKETA